MISTGDVRKGVIIELDGQLMKVLDWTHIKIARGSAQVRMKLQNVRRGDIIERTFQAGTRWPRARVEQRKVHVIIGPLAAFLTYASGREATTLGKPSPLLYDAVAQEVGASRGEIVMVGDDAEFDASAGVALGMQGVLVKTGKYRPGDEERHQPRPTAVLASVGDLPGWLGID